MASFSRMPEKLSAPNPVHPVDFFKQPKICAIWRATVDEDGHYSFAVPL
jgi:hypothetical protein